MISEAQTEYTRKLLMSPGDSGAENPESAQYRTASVSCVTIPRRSASRTSYSVDAFRISQTRDVPAR